VAVDAGGDLTNAIIGELMLTLPGQSEVRRRPEFALAVWASDWGDEICEQARHNGAAQGGQAW
jgi:hypothetical protein